MKNIYELKASKYKYKYKKLLQELTGGTIAQQEAEYKEYTIVQKESNGVLPEQTFEDYLRTKAEYENYKITQSKAPSVLVYIPSYLDFIRLEEEERRKGFQAYEPEPVPVPEPETEFQEYEQAQQRNPEQLVHQTFDNYLLTKNIYEEYRSKQLLAPTLLVYTSSYLDFMLNNEVLLTGLEAYERNLQTEADYERYILTQQQPIISYQQFVELENQRRANDAMRRNIIRFSVLLQRRIDRGERSKFSNYAKIAANTSAIFLAKKKLRQ